MCKRRFQMLMENLLGGILIAYAGQASEVLAQPHTLNLPPETVNFKPGRGSEIAKAQCLICHSADYVSTQPLTTKRENWQAIVIKMQKAFGAPISDPQVSPLVDYLVKHYGDEIKK